MRVPCHATFIENLAKNRTNFLGSSSVHATATLHQQKKKKNEKREKKRGKEIRELYFLISAKCSRGRLRDLSGHSGILSCTRSDRE